MLNNPILNNAINYESDKERNHERRMSDVLKQQKFDFIITVRYSYEFYDKEVMPGRSWPFSDYLIYLPNMKSSVLKLYS